MATKKTIEDFNCGVQPLISEIISFELISRGIQPANGLNQKKIQLARELFDEYNGKEPEISFRISTLDNLNSCATLLIRFDRDIRSNFRTVNSLHDAQSNVKFLFDRLQRISTYDESEVHLHRDLIEKAKYLLQVHFEPPTAPIQKPPHPSVIEIQSETPQTSQASCISQPFVHASQSISQPPSQIPPVQRTIVTSSQIPPVQSAMGNRPISHHEVSQNNGVNGMPYSTPHNSRVVVDNLPELYGLSLSSINNSRTQANIPVEQVNNFGTGSGTQSLQQYSANAYDNSPFGQATNFSNVLNAQQPFRNIPANLPQPLNHGILNDSCNYSRNPFLGHGRIEVPVHNNTFIPHSNLNDEFGQPIENRTFTLPQNNSNSYNFKPIPIYKWNIKFGGDGKTDDVFVFLQKINSKARAQNVSEEELFVFASELFTGFAVKWFHAQSFSSWTDISIKLISDFVQVDYFDNLLDTIRNRKQEYTESVVKFFTNFEDSCSRLMTPLSAEEKVTILKKNILQKYRPYVVLTHFQTVDEMKYALKILEATMVSNEGNKNVRFGSRDKNRSFSAERNKETSENNNNRSRYDRFQATDSKKGVDFRNRSNSNSSNHSKRGFSPANNYRPPTPMHSVNNQNSRNNSRETVRGNSREKSLNKPLN